MFNLSTLDTKPLISLKTKRLIYLLQELLEHREKDEVVKLVSTTSHGTTPLVIACRNGHYDVAEYLIEKCGANVNQPGLGKIVTTL